MLDYPVRQGSFKTDVTASLFRFDPLVPQYLFPFSLKLTVQGRVLEQIVGRELLFRFVRHSRDLKLAITS